MLNLATFAERLKKARNDKKMTQKQLAEAVGLSTATVSSYENSERTDGKMPTLDKVFAISELLGVSVDWLCGKASDQTNTIDIFDAEKLLRDMVYEPMQFDTPTYTDAEIIMLNHIAALLLSGFKYDGEAHTLKIDRDDDFSKAVFRLQQMSDLYHKELLPDYAVISSVNSLTDKYFNKKVFPSPEDNDL